MEALFAIVRATVELLKDPLAAKLIGGCIATWFVAMLVTAAVTAMEKPSPTSSPRYKFWFRFLHVVVGAWKRNKLVGKVFEEK
jgi:hypothetical protein